MNQCKMCKESDATVINDGDVCDDCWYNMRLNPEYFEEKMKSKGIEVVRKGYGSYEVKENENA